MRRRDGVFMLAVTVWMAASSAAGSACAQPRPGRIHGVVELGLGLIDMKEIDAGLPYFADGGFASDHFPVVPSLALGADWLASPRIVVTGRIGVTAPVASRTGFRAFMLCPVSSSYIYDAGGATQDATTVIGHVSIGLRVRPLGPWGRYYLGVAPEVSLVAGDQGGPYRAVCSSDLVMPMNLATVRQPEGGAFQRSLFGGLLETGMLLGDRQQFDVGVRAWFGSRFDRNENATVLQVFVAWSPL